MLPTYFLVWVSTGVFLISATATKERPESRNESRIYVPGGRPARPGEFPFLVMLEYVTGTRRGGCTGSIPSPTTVLTCAHCNGDTITAYAGLISADEKKLRKGHVQVRTVESKVVHERPFVYDIMVCHVNPPWQWTEFVAPIALQLGQGSLQISFAIHCQVIGFGQTEPYVRGGVAHVMDQLIGSSGHCWDSHESFIFFSFHMCSLNVEHKTVCPGDSGGPAVCGGKQWALSRAVRRPDQDLWPQPMRVDHAVCRPPKEINLYVYVDFYREWILKNIKDLPSSADSTQRRSMKISMYEALLNQTLWLTLLMSVQLFYLH